MDAVALEGRARELATRSIKRESKGQGLRMAVAMTDLTTLEGADTEGKVHALCHKALHPLPGRRDVGPVAAVCVYPDRVALASGVLSGTDVVVASVATGFPAGRIPAELKLEEVRRAVADGAAEIDMVIDRGAFHAGRYGDVFDEVCRIKDVCGEAHLKVILETGELGTYDAIARAARIAIRGGADFIKTSTGKIPKASSLPTVLLMLETVRDHYLETGQRVGVKAAGGIRTAKDALRYLVLVNETCGDRWLDPAAFRFGASSLLDDLLRQLRRLEDGRYQRLEDFGGD